MAYTTYHIEGQNWVDSFFDPVYIFFLSRCLSFELKWEGWLDGASLMMLALELNSCFFMLFIFAVFRVNTVCKSLLVCCLPINFAVARLKLFYRASVSFRYATVLLLVHKLVATPIVEGAPWVILSLSFRSRLAHIPFTISCHSSYQTCALAIDEISVISRLEPTRWFIGHFQKAPLMVNIKLFTFFPRALAVVMEVSSVTGRDPRIILVVKKFVLGTHTFLTRNTANRLTIFEVLI